MRKFQLNLLMYIVASVLVLFTACGPDPEPTPTPEPDKLSVDPKELEFAADDDDEQFVDVTSNVKTWKAGTSANWISINEGTNDFAVTVDQYTKTDKDRTGTITVTAGNAEPVKIKVVQRRAGINTLSVNPTSIIFETGVTGTKNVTIATNATSWDAPNPVNWLVLEKQGNTLRITAPNTSSVQRSTSITVTAGNANPVTITVTQYGGDDPGVNTLSVNPTSFQFAATPAGAQTATITTNAASWDAKEAPAWLTLQKTGNTLSITAAANTGSAERTGSFIVTAGTATPVTVTVKQEGGTTCVKIVESTYVGTGTPQPNASPKAPATWTGRVVPKNENQFEIRGWAGVKDDIIYCKYKDCKIILDTENNIAADNNYIWWFLPCYSSGQSIYLSMDEYIITYYESTRTLDFSGTIKGYTASFAWFAFDKSTYAVKGCDVSTFYTSPKLVLTPVSSSAPQHFSQSTYSDTKPNNIVIDKSKLAKALREVKYINVDSSELRQMQKK